jgi:hypothetical protein
MSKPDNMRGAADKRIPLREGANLKTPPAPMHKNIGSIIKTPPKPAKP